jgi:DNA-binding transcriptional ArsR family regulator
MTDQPGTPGNPLAMTDPRQMRALAHPARIAILQYLVLEGSHTATECAAVANLSPSACSYHLRTLAKYGFIEEDRSAATDSRERPWRAKVISMSIHNEPGTPAATRAAGEVLSAAYRASMEELRERYDDRRATYSAAWQRALGESYDTVFVTPDELEELKGRITELIGKYRRLEKHDQPTAGGRVMVSTEFTPWFTPEEAP